MKAGTIAIVLAALLTSLVVGIWLGSTPPDAPTIYEVSIVAFGDGLMEYTYQIRGDKTTVVLRHGDLDAYRAYLSRYGTLITSKH